MINLLSTTYSYPIENALRKDLPMIRKRFKTLLGAQIGVSKRFYCGARFLSDNAVIELIEANFSESQAFISAPQVIWFALHQAATLDRKEVEKC